MFRLVTGYFTWNFLVWSAIFFFSALFLVLVLRFSKKQSGMYVSNAYKDDQETVGDAESGRWRDFIRNAFGFWFLLPQAQLLLLAVIVLFFALAVLSGGNGGGNA